MRFISLQTGKSGPIWLKILLTSPPSLHWLSQWIELLNEKPFLVKPAKYPPGCGCSSTSATLSPALERSAEAVRPAIPAPITTTSHSEGKLLFDIIILNSRGPDWISCRSDASPEGNAALRSPLQTGWVCYGRVVATLTLRTFSSTAPPRPSAQGSIRLRRSWPLP